ncbi:hypothetical protein EZV62_023845 [Acer yangbiense]|uniref:Small ribosomal subunit protein uS7 domain-containing protein n=1 Tax=Acer yangbiense TaxID=1000413 RepID=A0A5C7H340_9ROSI|nr:hypothetical protein EZV62_023845 [Acer yangbiense]
MKFYHLSYFILAFHEIYQQQPRSFDLHFSRSFYFHLSLSLLQQPLNSIRAIQVLGISKAFSNLTILTLLLLRLLLGKMATDVVVQAPLDAPQAHYDVKLFNLWTFEDVQPFNNLSCVFSCYSGPREATRIGSAGVVRHQAVDISPLRRVNQAIYLLTTGVCESAFRNIKTIAECLADELINAAKGSSNSYAIKKDEIERVAKANR